MIDWTDFCIQFEIFVNGMWIREYQTLTELVPKNNFNLFSQSISWSRVSARYAVYVWSVIEAFAELR